MFLSNSQPCQLEGVPSTLLEANIFSYFALGSSLLQSSLQVTVTQADLRLQCQELRSTTELLSSISSYIHACNQTGTKQSCFGFGLGSFATPTEIWASCVPDVTLTYRMLECSFNYLIFQCLPTFEPLRSILNLIL